MKNIREVLKKAIELKEFAIKRAEEVLRARGIDYPVFVYGYSFTEEEFLVKFSEKTDNDYQREEAISIQISFLESDDEIWAWHIKNIKDDVIIQRKNK